MVGFLRTTIILALTVLVFTLTVQARLDPSTRCLERYEEYNACGTACPITCEDIRTPNVQKPCTLLCVAGCFCRKGFVRENEEPNSPCVEIEACRSKA